VTSVVKRKKEAGGPMDDKTRAVLAPGAAKVARMDISADTWEGVPDLTAGKERKYTARIVYANLDGQTIYSKPYTLIFRIEQ
jgi:hypothetical protein